MRWYSGAVMDKATKIQIAKGAITAALAVGGSYYLIQLIAGRS